MTTGLWMLGALALTLILTGLPAWVALLGITVLGEKYAPAHWHAERYVAAVLTVAAIIIFVG